MNVCLSVLFQGIFTYTSFIDVPVGVFTQFLYAEHSVFTRGTVSSRVFRLIITCLQAAVTHSRFALHYQSTSMGRRSSDSEDDSRSRRKRKQRRRSSSSSSSSSSSGSRVRSSRSRRSSRRSRSRSRDRRRKRRSSSTSSHSSTRRRRSRSAERDKGRSHRSHRSRSRDKRSHSRHRRSHSRSDSRRAVHSRKRSHSRSREKDRSRRKGRDREKEKDKYRDRGRDRDKDREKDKSKDKTEKKEDTGSLMVGLEHLTPAEQAKVRMQMVLQAAAKTDEVLKAKVAQREEEARKKIEEEGTSLEEQVRRIKDIEAIESDSFVPQAFKSSRDVVKTEPAEVKVESERAYSQDISLPTSIIYNDNDTLAHPSLFVDKEQAEELWLNRLVSLRQERLMGSPVT
uniref:Arginine and serine rich coiled-coil 1 n=2 Tax=Oryzias latipes TaxID=8090 RepID=A0A3B3HHZ5_ORYLA